MESLVKQLKAMGLNEKAIMDTFYETFQKGKMDRKDLEACARFMGYELTDEFKNDPTPDPIASAGAGAEGGITQEQAEAAKEIQPGESQADFQESISGGSAPSEPSEGEPNPAEEPKSEEDDEAKGWEEAQKKLKW